MASCASVRVSSDYDKNVDFKKYKTFAFYKKGIDKVDISDLDKRRILRAIESDLLNKGFTKSENPDLYANEDELLDKLFDSENKIYSYSFPLALSKDNQGKLRSGRMIYEFLEIRII